MSTDSGFTHDRFGENAFRHRCGRAFDSFNWVLQRGGTNQRRYSPTNPCDQRLLRNRLRKTGARDRRVRQVHQRRETLGRAAQRAGGRPAVEYPGMIGITRTVAGSAAFLIAAAALGACGLAPAHSPREYAGAVAIGDPDGSFTTMVGPSTAIVRMSSTVKFPSGDTESGIRSLLMYYRPANRAGMCEFQVGHAAQYSNDIVKEPAVQQPCDGKGWAKFRIAGEDFAFVAHLKRTRYKNVPVTLLEIDDQRVPAGIRLVY